MFDKLFWGFMTELVIIMSRLDNLTIFGKEVMNISTALFIIGNLLICGLLFR